LQLVSGSMHAMNSMGYTVTAGTAVGQHSMPAYVNADKNKDADLVTIFAGTNDFGRSVAMPLGTMADDANTESFYGRLKLTCDLLSAKYPNALVILATPLPRHDCADGTKGTVEPTKTLVDYADAIRQVAALYSFPVLDLTRESGMQMRSKAFRTAYMADNIHPNAAGHAKFIAPALERFILQHTPVM
jgi:lipase/acylhydrolase domain protein